MINFLDPHYLIKGNKRQREVYSLISDMKIMQVLGPYTPVIAGTIPIDVDIENSDIDILCSYDDPKEFEDTLRRHFSQQQDFKVKSNRFRGRASLLAAFLHRGQKLEIFGQMLPVQEQDGFVHMVVEYRILQMCTERFREKVRKLKGEGVCTEPAFARLLSIETDPYEALLRFKDLSDDELRTRIPEQYRTGL
jgi:hypothetical protein